MLICYFSDFGDIIEIRDKKDMAVPIVEDSLVRNGYYNSIFKKVFVSLDELVADIGISKTEVLKLMSDDLPLTSALNRELDKIKGSKVVPFSIGGINFDCLASACEFFCPSVSTERVIQVAKESGSTVTEVILALAQNS